MLSISRTPNMIDRQAETELVLQSSFSSDMLEPCCSGCQSGKKYTIVMKGDLPNRDQANAFGLERLLEVRETPGGVTNAI